MRFRVLNGENIMKFTWGTFAFMGVFTLGYRFYAEWKYPVDEFGLPLDCKCRHCN